MVEQHAEPLSACQIRLTRSYTGVNSVVDSFLIVLAQSACLQQPARFGIIREATYSICSRSIPLTTVLG